MNTRARTSPTLSSISSWHAGLGALLLLALSFLGGPVGASDFSPKESDFSVEAKTPLTGETAKTKLSLPGTEEIEIAWSNFRGTLDEVAYSVGYADLPPQLFPADAIREETIAKILKAAAEIQGASLGGKMEQNDEITLAGKYPGREVTVSLAGSPTIIHRAKLILVRHRLFLIRTSSPGYNENAEAFLDSFRVRGL